MKAFDRLRICFDDVTAMMADGCSSRSVALLLLEAATYCLAIKPRLWNRPPVHDVPMPVVYRKEQGDRGRMVLKASAKTTGGQVALVTVVAVAYEKGCFSFFPTYWVRLGLGALAILLSTPLVLAVQERPKDVGSAQVVVTIPGYPTHTSHAPVLYVEPPVGPQRFLPHQRVGDAWIFSPPKDGLVWLTFHYGGLSVVPNSLHDAAHAFGDELEFGMDLSSFEVKKGDLAAVASPGLRGLKMCNHLRSTGRGDLEIFLGDDALSVAAGSLTDLHLCLDGVSDALLATRLRECVNLEALTLEGCEGVGEAVLAALRSMPRLRRLRLIHSPFSPGLQKEVFSLQALEEIRLSTSHPLDRDDWDALSQLESLASLEVDYVDLPAGAATAVGRISRLAALRIGGHWHGSREVVEELVKLRNWTGFEIMRCELVDDDILVQLAKCSRLQWLGLLGCAGFTVEGLQVLAQAGDLRDVYLGNYVPFAEDAAKQLRVARPDLAIYVNQNWNR